MYTFPVGRIGHKYSSVQDAATTCIRLNKKNDIWEDETAYQFTLSVSEMETLFEESTFVATQYLS